MGSLLSKERVNFEDFVEWSISVSWTEEVQVKCVKEREVWRVAREQGMKLLDVERVKKMFDDFDTDGSGEIEEAEFRHIICKLWNVKDLSDVPIKQLQRFWRELDADGSGSVSFTEFLVWYQTHGKEL